MNHFGNVQKTSALTLTKDTSTQQAGTQQVQETSAQIPTKNTSPEFNTFVEFFSQDLLKPQDILTQEQIKALDVQFPDAGSGVDDIGLAILVLMAIGVDFVAAVQYAKDQTDMDKVLSKEQMKTAEKIYEGIASAYLTNGELPNEVLAGGAFSITTKEKEKKAKLKKTILIGVGATALIGGLIFLARKK